MWSIPTQHTTLCTSPGRFWNTAQAHDGGFLAASRVILLKSLEANLHLSLSEHFWRPRWWVAEKRQTVPWSCLGIVAVSKVLHPLKDYASSHRLVHFQLRAIRVSAAWTRKIRVNVVKILTCLIIVHVVYLSECLQS